MLYNRKMKTVFLFLILGSALLFASNSKKFDVESGMVIYDINGGGKLTSDTKLTIKGDGKLRFKDWGVVALVEENYEELTSGAIRDLNKVQICEKFEDKQRFDVDFGTEKIFERPMPKGNFKEYYLKGLVKTGQEEIAGYTCDVWEGKGVKKCLYKGIPLLSENYLWGIYYQKKAVEVKLNIETSDSKCVLPDFPVEKFALFKTNIKTKNIKLPNELSSVIVHVSKALRKSLKDNKLLEDELTEQQKQLWLDKLGQNVYKRQMKFLPEMLLTMKSARVCLQQVDNVNEANDCIMDVINMKKKISQNENNGLVLWSEVEKNRVMDEFDTNISLLESKMKCIRAAKNISDLSVCMK